MFNRRLWIISALTALLMSPSAMAYRKPPIENPVTPQWTEQYLHDVKSPLLAGSDEDHVMSYYYFGALNGRTLMGLERVKGSDYEQFFSLLVFQGQNLVGYYQDVPSFPSGVSDQGNVTFPRGIDAHIQGTRQSLNILSNEFGTLCHGFGDEEVCVDWQSVSR